MPTSFATCVGARLSLGGRANSSMSFIIWSSESMRAFGPFHAVT